MNAIDFVHQQLTTKKQFPNFKAGDNISVNYKIVEGNKERIQSFKGDVIKRQGNGFTATFTVRKVSDGVGVERTFPIFSPNIESIDINKSGRVRRAKLYFLRERSGKSARIKEKKDLPSSDIHCYLKRSLQERFFVFPQLEPFWQNQRI